MHVEVFSNQAQFQDLINVARGNLATIRAFPSLDPEPDSPAHLVFDTTFARRLHTFVPFRIIPVPAPEVTWNRINALLDGWQELSLLAQATDISTWDVRYYLIQAIFAESFTR
jgi:N-alpha-acetyltransferase 35, NatC auxiliary subunit